MKIHPTSIIEPGAKLGVGVNIGPFCCVGKDVVLGDHVELISHISISGLTMIGEKTKIFPFASIGHRPQDLKYAGEPSKTIIGSNNMIREYVTIQPGTAGDAMQTVVGDHCLFMVGSHVAHDCIVGNHVIMANNATLAGHVKIGDYAIIGGLAAVKQRVRIGDHAMIGGMAGVEHDVIPFGMIVGERGWLNGLNLVGLKRRGFSKDAINKLQNMYSSLFTTDDQPLSERFKTLREKYTDDEDVRIILDFLDGQTNSLCQPKAV
ncbi:MAG: acyl-ACP--UDP-N-acetylglucosamine O-acyltransferase [Pseudomonadota bacterium]|jgi:UDP-N-acetylglucosamine acyltransferase|nr:acyl-ACP--UDP-N-acetylglucosamine O-acyltransferase [Alphaproteobacteria bacterium]